MEYTQFEEEHGHYFQTNNIKIHYSTWGNPSDIPFLWIHGTNSNTTEIVEIVDSLIQNKYYVIAIDYYGHGLTPIPSEDVSIYNVADDINELLDFLKIEKIIVAGWSRGGVIASALYDSYSKKVKGLVLLDGGSASFLKARQSINEDTLRIKYEKIYSSPEITFKSEFDAFKYYYNPKWLDSQYWWFSLLKENKKNQWSLNPGLKEWLGQGNAEEGLRNIYKTTKAPLFEASTLQLAPEIIYRNLNVPMLIFDPQGDDSDGFFDFSEQNMALKKQHPEMITLKQYPNSGHAVHFEQPEKFITDLLLFLNKLN
jgi:pimeloyl-ACP methyl ester carboxylesterase